MTALRGLLPNCVTLIRRYPIAIFQFTAFALHHENRAAWILLGLAMMVDREVQRLEEAEAWLTETWKVLRFVQKHKENTFTRFGLRDVLDDTAFRRFSNELVPPLQARWDNRLRSRLGWPSVDDEVLARTRLFTVQRGQTRTRPGPTSFMTGRGGFIFLTEQPANIKGVQKFNMLHELGHLSPRSKFVSRRGRSGVAPFFALLFWSVPQLLLPQVTTASMFVIGVGWFLVTNFRDVHGYLDAQYGVVLDEILADQFAILTLTPAEVKQVAKTYSGRSLSADSTLKDDNLRRLDEERRKILAANLKEAIATQGNIKHYYSLPQHEMNTPAYLGLLIMIGLLFRAGQPTCNAGAAELLLVVAAITIGRSFKKAGDRLQRYIDITLGAGVSPASSVKTWPSEPRWQKIIRNVFGYESNLILDMSFAQRYRRALPSTLFLVLGLALVTFLNSMPDENWCR